jgi:CarD family transcriptional regulator
MKFYVGDKVIHRTYGLGEIVQIEDKELLGKKQLYYVVRLGDLMVWVPVNDEVQTSLRPPTPQSEFSKMFEILSSPCQPLSSDRFERKSFLAQKMKEGNLEAICQVVRDLSGYRSLKKFNDDDATTLERATNMLLNEWNFTLFVPRKQAELELKKLLKIEITTK